MYKGCKVIVTFTNQGEFHIFTCSKKIANPDNISLDQVVPALRALIGKGKGNEKGRKSFTVV